MADVFNSYITQYGYPPKYESHLIAFGKKNGKKIKYLEAKQLIARYKENDTTNNNKNVIFENKKESDQSSDTVSDENEENKNDDDTENELESWMGSTYLILDDCMADFNEDNFTKESWIQLFHRYKKKKKLYLPKLSYQRKGTFPFKIDDNLLSKLFDCMLQFDGYNIKKGNEQKFDNEMDENEIDSKQFKNFWCCDTNKITFPDNDTKNYFNAIFEYFKSVGCWDTFFALIKKESSLNDIKFFYESYSNYIDINRQNWIGRTVLHRAIFRENENDAVELIKYLFKIGADRKIKDEDGETAADTAISLNMYDLAVQLQ